MKPLVLEKMSTQLLTEGLEIYKLVELTRLYRKAQASKLIT